jgi:acyl-CoA synthetase (AMP-forming)/AMP-acid ligase II
VLAKKSLPTRIWMATGKRVYYWVTRGIFRFVDREGGGPRLVQDAPSIASRLKTHPQVRDVAVVAFPDRRTGVGLYAFVEAPGASESAINEFVAADPTAVKAPERLQLVDALPRSSAGAVRSEIDRSAHRQRHRAGNRGSDRRRSPQPARPDRFLGT